MTSKNLFFKLSYEDLKSRLWTLALVILFFLFMFPVSAVYLAGEKKEIYEAAEWVIWYQSNIIDLITAENGFIGFMIVILAMVCGMTSFSYLNYKNKVDFYHSIPVKREKIYFANYINGIWLVALPYALFLMAGIGLAVSNGAGLLPLLSEGVKGYAMHMTYYLLVYSTVVVVMMLTGNRIVGFMGVMVFFFYIPSAAAIAESCFYTWFRTYTGEANFLRIILMEFSPIASYLNSMSGYRYDGVILARIGAALTAFVILTVIGLVLYKKRPSEAAGKAMAFRVTKPVIRILIVMLCSVSMEIFGWNLRENMGWTIFCMLCGCIISHCVIEIIYNFDFKKLFGHKFQLLGCIAASILILVVFRYDLFGYDRYIPRPEQVSNVTVSLSGLDGWVNYGTVEQNSEGGYRWKHENSSDYRQKNMKITDPSAVLRLAQTGIDRNNKIRSESRKSIYDSGDYDREEDSVYTDVLIKYYLKGSKTVSRSYYISVSAAEDIIKSLYASEEYQRGIYPILNQTEEETAYVIYRKDKNQRKESRLSQESPELVSEILKTYQEEWMKLTMEERKTEIPVGTIRFVKKTEVPAIEWARNSLTQDYEYYYNSNSINNVEYYPVYPSFEKTLGLLAENGVDVRDSLEGFTAESVSVLNRYSGTEQAVIFKDPEQVEEIMKHVVLAENADYNFFIRRDYNVDLSIRFEKQGITQEYDYYFKEGQIPEFVKQRIGE